MAHGDAAFGGMQHGAEERGEEEGADLAEQKVDLRGGKGKCQLIIKCNECAEVVLGAMWWLCI